MAKGKKSVKKVGGPFLAAAIFCESIMEDKGGKISALGIMDGCQFFISPDAPADVPSKSHPITMMQNMLFIFRSGDSPGKHDLRIVMQQPDGKRSEVGNQKIDLSAAPNGGVNVKTAATMAVYTSGTYWLDVYLDGDRFTRMPLNISIQRLPLTPNAKKK